MCARIEFHARKRNLKDDVHGWHTHSANCSMADLFEGLWHFLCSGKTSLLFQYAHSVCMADPEAIVLYVGKQIKLEENPPCLPKVWPSF